MKLKSFPKLMMVIAICLGTLLFGASSPAWAQQAAGSITGTVLDPSGGAIPNATVTVRDADRGTVWTTKTSSAGLYNFPQIPEGNVVVSVEASGFSKKFATPSCYPSIRSLRLTSRCRVGAPTQWLM